MVSVTAPPLSMRMKPLGTNAPFGPRTGLPFRSAAQVTSRPPPAAAAVMMKARRDGRLTRVRLAYGMTGPEAFATLDVRVGRIVRAEPNAPARMPAYKMWIDFGPLGEKTSSAQLVDLYKVEELVGKLVVAAVNLGVRRIAGFP